MSSLNLIKTFTARRSTLRMWSVAVLVFIFLFRITASQAAESNQQADQPQKEVQRKSEQPQEPLVELNKDYFTGYLTDTKNILTSPAGWETSDWIKASVVLGISVGLYTQDDKIQTWVQKNKNSTTSHIADAASTIYTYTLPALGVLGLYGYIADDEKAKRTLLLGIESFIITGAFVQTLKHSTGRHRPSTGDPHDTWSGPTREGSHMSFPSGDASSAFSIASVVASEYDNFVIPPLVYTAASLLALERVHNNAHWASDVFVGSAIGYFTGKAIVHYHSGKIESNLSLVPIIDGKELGFLVTFSY